jgi:hypothetical protein
VDLRGHQAASQQYRPAVRPLDDLDSTVHVADDKARLTPMRPNSRARQLAPHLVRRGEGTLTTDGCVDNRLSAETAACPRQSGEIGGHAGC